MHSIAWISGKSNCLWVGSAVLSLLTEKRTKMNSADLPYFGLHHRRRREPMSNVSLFFRVCRDNLGAVWVKPVLFRFIRKVMIADSLRAIDGDGPIFLPQLIIVNGTGIFTGHGCSFLSAGSDSLIPIFVC